MDEGAERMGAGLRPLADVGVSAGEQGTGSQLDGRTQPSRAPQLWTVTRRDVYNDWAPYGAPGTLNILTQLILASVEEEPYRLHSTGVETEAQRREAFCRLSPLKGKQSDSDLGP